MSETGHIDRSEVQLEDTFGFLFRRLSSMADTTFMAVTGQTQLTPMQMGVLMTVDRLTHPSLRELAREMHVDRSTTQELVDRMSKRGLLARRVSATDRRVHELWLTAEGDALLTQYRGAVDKVQKLLLAKLAPSEGEALIRALHRLLD